MLFDFPVLFFAHAAGPHDCSTWASLKDFSEGWFGQLGGVGEAIASTWNLRSKEETTGTGTEVEVEVGDRSHSTREQKRPSCTETPRRVLPRSSSSPGE